MVTLMAILAKEAIENIRDKEKKHLEKIFQKIEKEIQEDETLKSIISLNRVDNVEKLFLFIDNQKLKKELQRELQRLGIELKEIKISILNSAKEFNKHLEKIGIDESVIYYSMAAFRNGEKISGKVIKAMLEGSQVKLEEEKNKLKELEVYEFNNKNKKVRKTSLKNISKRKKEIEETEESIRKKKLMDDGHEIAEQKNHDIGMPKRGNIGISGPGL